MPHLSTHTLDALAIGAAAGAFVALLLALLALGRMRAVHRRFAVLRGPGGQEDVLTALSRHAADVQRVRAELSAARGELSTARGDVADAIRHVAVVRYDAFGDMGGRLSFSAALLDDMGDGLVLTSINGRTETRTYAKGIKGGRSEASLSPEEEQAIGLALHGSAPARA